MEFEHSNIEDDVIVLQSAMSLHGKNWVKIQKNFFPNYKITDVRKLHEQTSIEDFNVKSPLKHCSSDVCTFQPDMTQITFETNFGDDSELQLSYYE